MAGDKLGRDTLASLSPEQTWRRRLSVREFGLSARLMAKKPEQLHVRPPLERMLRFHNLAGNRAYPNCAKIAREFEVSVRTIMRDVAFMRDRFRLPIEFDAERRGYYYTRPVHEFPLCSISEAELFSLLVAHKVIDQYQGTPFVKPLDSAFRKLITLLGQNPDLSLGQLDEFISFRPFAPGDHDLEMFEAVTTAVRQRRCLRCLYRNLGAKGFVLRTIHPHHLACVENHWYLFAFDPGKKAMRTFLLARMKQVEVGKERFTPIKDFDPDEYLSGSLSVFKGSQDHEVVVDFDPWAAELVRGRRWHSTQKLIDLPENRLRIQMRLNSLEEAERWVLSWGTHAAVIKPKLLVNRLRATTAALHQLYGGGDPSSEVGGSGI